MTLYSTKEQARYGDFSYITVSDSDDGYAGRNCCDAYAQVIGVFYKTEKLEHLLGLESIEIIDENSTGYPRMEVCWPR